MQVRVVANRRTFFRPLAAIVAASVVLLTLLQVDFSSREEWRRTAHGWERSSAWLVAASGPAASLPKQSVQSPANFRLDTHPIVLAFVQVLGTLLALFTVAPNAAWPSHGGLLAAISRSFRASVFGS